MKAAQSAKIQRGKVIATRKFEYVCVREWLHAYTKLDYLWDADFKRNKATSNSIYQSDAMHVLWVPIRTQLSSGISLHRINIKSVGMACQN